jgi:hypothetical protein
MTAVAESVDRAAFVDVRSGFAPPDLLPADEL